MARRTQKRKSLIWKTAKQRAAKRLIERPGDVKGNMEFFFGVWCETVTNFFNDEEAGEIRKLRELWQSGSAADRRQMRIGGHSFPEFIDSVAKSATPFIPVLTPGSRDPKPQGRKPR